MTLKLYFQQHVFPSQIDGKVVQTLEQVLDVFDPVPKTGKPEKRHQNPTRKASYFSHDDTVVSGFFVPFYHLLTSKTNRNKIKMYHITIVGRSWV